MYLRLNIFCTQTIAQDAWQGSVHRHPKACASGKKITQYQAEENRYSRTARHKVQTMTAVKTYFPNTTNYNYVQKHYVYKGLELRPCKVDTQSL